MSHIRFRRIIEIQYREYRKIGGYFNRQNRKQVYKVWVRAKKQGFTQLDFNEFYWKIVTAGSNGVSYHEMKMNSKALDKYFKRRKESDT